MTLRARSVKRSNIEDLLRGLPSPGERRAGRYGTSSAPRGHCNEPLRRGAALREGNTPVRRRNLGGGREMPLVTRVPARPTDWLQSADGDSETWGADRDAVRAAR